jgi:GTP-binding protein
VPTHPGLVASDLDVDITREKKQTNTLRASTADEGIRVIPPPLLSLEQAIEFISFISDDELLEVTSKHLCVRKKVRRGRTCARRFLGRREDAQ